MPDAPRTRRYGNWPPRPVGHRSTSSYADTDTQRDIPPEEAKPTIHDPRQFDLVAAIEKTKRRPKGTSQ